jgi:hypothetical protein
MVAVRDRGDFCALDHSTDGVFTVKGSGVGVVCHREARRGGNNSVTGVALFLSGRPARSPKHEVLKWAPKMGRGA